MQGGGGEGAALRGTCSYLPGGTLNAMRDCHPPSSVSSYDTERSPSVATIITWGYNVGFGGEQGSISVTTLYWSVGRSVLCLIWMLSSSRIPRFRWGRGGWGAWIGAWWDKELLQRTTIHRQSEHSLYSTRRFGQKKTDFICASVLHMISVRRPHGA